ncbi:uncharacterized protein LOC132803918 isoform X2 [Ziziphus jujuba]|uniref:Uncharacterized protein LOC132803918 isoform X2 n=1 Tax=Ziziphus jujuba TaxID=326968 RepID=A0ABM4AAI2_ZIZJJ|nr:uncharacterized protein LOC132803918 isoform X2 [Ziziphus jujuba]
MAAEEEEEVVAEVEALRSVYGEDCWVLDSYPPHIHLHIKPRTADDISKQFVEAVIGIQAGFQEAVEKLTLMNHPDGDCPLCLYPLVAEDEQNNTLPFMKLLSCFHCFHSECIVRWWNWLQTEQKTNSSDSSAATTHPIRDMENKEDAYGAMEEIMGSCPVCRKVFHTRDFEHVLDLVGSHSSQLNCDEIHDGKELLHSSLENTRRQRFEAILKLQQDNSGLIEPKRHLSVSPGMFAPLPVTSNDTVTNKAYDEQQQRDSPDTSEMHMGDSSARPNTSIRRNSGTRKQKVQNFRRPVKQWIRKENARAE